MTEARNTAPNKAKIGRSGARRLSQYKVTFTNEVGDAVAERVVSEVCKADALMHGIALIDAGEVNADYVEAEAVTAE